MIPPTTTEITIEEAFAKVALVLKETKESDTPFQFNKFPIIIPAAEIFKVRGDTSHRYVCMEFINKQLRAIRRDGNWPKDLLRVENLEQRLSSYLLSCQDFDPDLYMYGDTYLYMEGPGEHSGLVATLAANYMSHGRTNNWWELVKVEAPSESINFNTKD